ncbi:vacuolar fusion protein MON1 [Xylaria bambusicola]|uniref:vacuolar fusion protein MON1 n=1 Tax=Xylaria bambusicola TaxID=326684 RepID=UPI0020086C26|nr:vacuolar fusion protein MON1 [Xylaria bambusicola]KAI0512546.1 vacuolar fusion protein MON1 [Xylaria bambusicola]
MTGNEDAGLPSGASTAHDEERPPPLPPRHSQPSTPNDRPRLASKPTTALSSMNIQTLSFPDGSRGTFSTAVDSSAADDSTVHPTDGFDVSAMGFRSIGSTRKQDTDESMSVMSMAPTLRPPGDLESLLVGDMAKKSPAWMLLRSQSAAVQPFETTPPEQTSTFASFEQEFEGIPDELDRDWNDGDRLQLWKSKLKHYMILSSAGKPIYSRHGDLGLINSSMGVVQTIISFYEGAKSPLLGFTAGDARFVIVTEGPLYFVAISRLGESDSQLRAQLNALYMQILSTLTLPVLTNIFANRPSTDLRRPLQGTETLLSSLADSFTRGSPSILLGALECLRLRKSHRHSINNAFLKARAEPLLYGLIVAGGRLVSVIRPRRHSLHPSDLQLIFNMLFESGGIKAAGGENWIPLCLPAFNNRGYLYMYVSFLDDRPEESTPTIDTPSVDETIAIILISPDKESFFALQKMRDDVVTELKKKGHLDLIKVTALKGRPSAAEIAPNTHISHFLFKSRANVQFCMPALQPTFSSLVSHRRLISLYSQLHTNMHARHSHLKVLHCVSDEATSLAWVTPIFEFYCVAGPNTSRAVLTQGANKVMQWAKREEERLFIIGGGVF